MSEPISVKLSDGREVQGTLCYAPGGMGAFIVSAKGHSKSDGRPDYRSLDHIRMIARQILREIATENPKDFR